MGTTKPTIKDLVPLDDRFERRLTASAMFLSYGDRMILDNSVLSSMPIHYLCTLDIPDGLIDVIDRAIRHCLSRKRSMMIKLTLWHPGRWYIGQRKKGGLGIINLKIQNKCLLLKHLHNFYNNADLPWVKLIKKLIVLSGGASCCYHLWIILVEKYLQAFRSIQKIISM
jgi:hypothetical protein